MPYTILNFSTSNAQVTDEIINVSDSNPINLEHDVFYNKTGKLVTIYTGAGETGTQLVEGTDYDVGGTFADSNLPTSISPDVAYTTIAITNATYHNTQLYVNYYPIGDLIQASRWNGEVRRRDPGYAVDEWDENEASAYDTAGVVVQRYGQHFASTGLTGNSNKDPIDPANVNYWYPSPGIFKLMQIAHQGMSYRGGMHKVNDVEDADYSTSLLIDKATFGSTDYEFYMVHLDASVVTGDSTLEAIFDPGGAAEYPFIDLYAPDDLGTRTLKDGRGTYNRAMTAAGGEAATRGERQEDQLHGFIVYSGVAAQNPAGVYGEDTTEVPGVEAWFVGTNSGSGTTQPISSTPKDDGTNGTPDTGSETRVKGIVEGVGYIVVMVAA